MACGDGPSVVAPDHAMLAETIGADARVVGDGRPASACVDEAPPPAPLRRLTRVEYDNTVRDLLGDTSAPAEHFPPDEVAGVFSNDAQSLSVTPLLAEKYMDAAELLAARAVSNLPALVDCDWSQLGEETCARDFVTRFGRRAYRRPLREPEVVRLMTLYTGARAEPQADFAWGIEVLVQAFLQSPQFLYRFEPATPTAADRKLARLTPHELATRLSYLVWGTMPDPWLGAKADAGELASADQLGTTVREMLDDPRARPALAEFYRQWLGLGALADLYKDPKVYPEFTPALRDALEGEVPAFVEQVLFRQDASLTSLLTAPLVSGQGPLAAFYGVPSSDGLENPIVAADPAQRSGILTLASVLSVYGLPNQSSPIHRGKLVRERLLCQALSPPPPGVIVTAPEVDPGRPTSERFAAHRANPACAGCHDLMDPIGLGFEEYDGIGRFRTTDGGLAVDDSGHVTGTTDIDGDFRGARALATELAGSAQVQNCVALQWFHYAFGRPEQAGDRCALQAMDQAFEQSGGDLRELLVALSQTDSFSYRERVDVADDGVAP
jgi:hypothetical protein